MSKEVLLGVPVDLVTMQDLNAHIQAAVAGRQRRVIAHHNLHSIYLCHRNEKLRGFYGSADLAHIDGMALVMMGNLLGLPCRREHRTTYADWFGPLLTEGMRQGWRIFYLGSKPGVAEQGASILRERYPGLVIATAHGYFDATAGSAESRAVLDQITAFAPDVLMVGMGMPRQEFWVLDHLDALGQQPILLSGAAIDYVAGVIPTPPRWAGQWSLEWLFRLIAEPRRLWRRYLVEPWFVLGLFLKEMWSGRGRSRGSIDDGR